LTPNVPVPTLVPAIELEDCMAVADLVDATWEPLVAVPTIRGLIEDVGGMLAALLGEMEEAAEDGTGASRVCWSWLIILGECE
jgi:hypothetical protein